MSATLTLERSLIADISPQKSVYRFGTQEIIFLRHLGARGQRTYSCPEDQTTIPINLLPVISESNRPLRYDTLLPVVTRRPNTYCPTCQRYITATLSLDIDDKPLFPSTKNITRDTVFTDKKPTF